MRIALKRGMAWRGPAGQGAARHGKGYNVAGETLATVSIPVLCTEAGRGAVGRGPAWLGPARPGMARHGEGYSVAGEVF